VLVVGLIERVIHDSFSVLAPPSSRGWKNIKPSGALIRAAVEGCIATSCDDAYFVGEIYFEDASVSGVMPGVKRASCRRAPSFDG
jgi:hypothetical protein